MRPPQEIADVQERAACVREETVVCSNRGVISKHLTGCDYSGLMEQLGCVH